MGRLSPMQRVQVIAIYNDLHDLKVLKNAHFGALLQLLKNASLILHAVNVNQC